MYVCTVYHVTDRMTLNVNVCDFWHLPQKKIMTFDLISTKTYNNLLSNFFHQAFSFFFTFYYQHQHELQRRGRHLITLPTHVKKSHIT